MENREIDFLIFEHVFQNEKGFVEWLKKQKEELDLNLSIIKRYSTDIKDAWSVVEKFEYFNIRYEGHWYCEVYKDGKYYFGDHDTAPMAICDAALRSVGVEI
jgi:hypothetical protein